MIGLAANLASYDATGLAQAIRSREFSVVAVLEAFFERIDAINSGCNAFVTLDKANALRRAREADDDLSKGKIWGTLHGVPVSIKDAFDTAGIRTTAGYVPYSEFIPDQDAFAVAQLKGAGAIVIGKTNCAKLCCDIQTTNSIFGATKNPWDKERTAGGSSGGEAAAVALGLSVLGIGSDTSGSIRIPSSYCGVYGFKPSIGKISCRGLKPLHDSDHPRPDSMTVVGPIAKSVRDLILCYEVLSGESVSAEPSKQASLESTEILWTDKFSEQVVADEVSAVLTTAFDRLKGGGANVKKVDSPLDIAFINKNHKSLCGYEFVTKEFSRGVYHLFWSIEVIRSCLSGGLDARYRSIKKIQMDASKILEAFLDKTDCWVLPATPTAAFLHQKMWWPIPLKVNGKLRRTEYFEASTGLTAMVNFLGNPSVVIPVGKSESGMPVAIQVIGKRGEDVKLLKVASCIADKIGQQWSCPSTIS